MTDASASRNACVIDGCPWERYGRKPHCERHNYRLRKYGDPLGGKYMQAGKRGDFWSKVDKNGPIPDFAPLLGRCWCWLGSKNNDGYPTVGLGNKKVGLAHRVSYEQLVGPVPKGKQLDHLCRNRLCVNPDHLEPVTGTVNRRRSPFTVASVNSSKTHCVHGHLFDEANTKLSPEGYRSCRQCMRDRGKRYQLRKLAKRSEAAA